MKSVLIKILKFIGWLALLMIVGIGSFLGYEQYERAEKLKAELKYGTSADWEWYDKYGRIQIRYDEKAKKTYLRKTYVKDKYVIYAYKHEDYSLGAYVYFIVDCKANSTITTSKTFNSGAEKKLLCTPEGNALQYGVTWSERNSNVVWEEDLDGFKFRENFGSWDFSVLDREITLSKAE
ncbi:hypothetical protein L1077_26050 [Pseudoalteromonas luteoviolacea]|uniref:hypothetical protein n=1 Tax=Pseudoalteromonas luteoviolacea TaxID=43657 RepID=UPI001F40EDD0|nr:hypothetical protein [Pseudoalteromonas luteoviolacea]MCF6442891.1 hypothetical protein [Pseudoalteromonas luteoviolacea]